MLNPAAIDILTSPVVQVLIAVWAVLLVHLNLVASERGLSGTSPEFWQFWQFWQLACVKTQNL